MGRKGTVYCPVSRRLRAKRASLARFNKNIVHSTSNLPMDTSAPNSPIKFVHTNTPDNGDPTSILGEQAEQDIINIMPSNVPTSNEGDQLQMSVDNSDIETEVEQQSSENNAFELLGRRIVDLGYVWKQIKNIKHFPYFNCTIDMCDIVDEKREGFASKLILKCNSCTAHTTIYSENREENAININSAAVLASISIGTGHSQLNEFMSVINVPCISSRKYKFLENTVGELVETSLAEEIKLAGEEEAKIAIQKGHVDQDGVPCITVIADGAWSKRSYRTNYNALSGVGVIIGSETKKILHIGVRNKYCSVCSKAKNKNIVPKPHTCFQNWRGTSTSMESDIIAKGFQKSIECHGLKYVKLIADGDSSVTKKIMQQSPYGLTVIQKIECINHLLRNFCNKLKEIAKKSRSSTNQIIPVNLRRKLNANISKFRTAIKKAAEYRHGEAKPYEERLAMFRKDINNSVHHIFGDHQQCATYFCQGTKENEENVYPAVENCGMKDDIQKCLQRITDNAASCFTNLNNNPAEQYFSLLNKFVGGKRVNFSLRQAYQIRCMCSAISYNTKGSFVQTLVKKAQCEEDVHLTKYVQKIQLKRKNASKRKPRSNNDKKRRTAEADEDYGNLDQIDINTQESNTQKIIDILSKGDAVLIEQMTRGQSRNHMWVQERQYRLTASNFGRICKRRDSTNPLKLLESLIFKNFSGTAATRYGNEHEQHAIEMFTNITGLAVTSCGLFIGTDDEFYMGASPDGIIDDNSILEVKCPINASNMSIEDAVNEKKLVFLKKENNVITLNRNHDYFYQIQGQLHLAKREWCYFVVWSPIGELFIENIKRDDDFWEGRMKPKLSNFFEKSFLPKLARMI